MYYNRIYIIFHHGVLYGCAGEEQAVAAREAEERPPPLRRAALDRLPVHIIVK